MPSCLKGTTYRAVGQDGVLKFDRKPSDGYPMEQRGIGAARAATCPLIECYHRDTGAEASLCTTRVIVDPKAESFEGRVEVDGAGAANHRGSKATDGGPQGLQWLLWGREVYKYGSATRAKDAPHLS